MEIEDVVKLKMHISKLMKDYKDSTFYTSLLRLSNILHEVALCNVPYFELRPNLECPLLELLIEMSTIKGTKINQTLTLDNGVLERGEYSYRVNLIKDTCNHLNPLIHLHIYNLSTKMLVVFEDFHKIYEFIQNCKTSSKVDQINFPSEAINEYDALHLQSVQNEYELLLQRKFEEETLANKINTHHELITTQNTINEYKLELANVDNIIKYADKNNRGSDVVEK